MEKSKKRIIQGTVLSRSGDKTIRITVERKVMHPKYHKIVKRFKNYLVHDEKNEIKDNAAVKNPTVDIFPKNEIK